MSPRFLPSDPPRLRRLRRRPGSARRRTGWWTLLLACSAAWLPGAGPTLTVDGLVFRSIDDAADSTTELREYVPEGESPDDWTHLIGLRHYAAPQSAQTFVEELAALYASEHPALACAGHRNRVTGQCALDFALPGDGFVEWNFIRATPAGDGGLDVVQYAVRLPFIDHPGEVNDLLHATRARLLPILVAADYREQPATDTDATDLAGTVP